MGFMDIFKIKEFKSEIDRLQSANQELLNSNEVMNSQLQELGAFDYYKIKEMTDLLQSEYHQKEKDLQTEYADKIKQAETDLSKRISRLEEVISDREEKSTAVLSSLDDLRLQEAKLTKSVKTQTNKLARSKELVKAINYTFEKYLNYEPSQSTIKLPENDLSDLEEISPSVILKLHCMDVKDLRKAYRENDKQINTILEKYSARYTTKANQAIYKLMVIALRAELQNILYNLNMKNWINL